jgi:hypothetical protein
MKAVISTTPTPEGVGISAPIPFSCAIATVQFDVRGDSSVYLSLLGYKKTLNKPPPLPACLAC